MLKLSEIDASHTLHKDDLIQHGHEVIFKYSTNGQRLVKARDAMILSEYGLREQTDYLIAERVRIGDKRPGVDGFVWYGLSAFVLTNETFVFLKLLGIIE